MTSQNSGRNEKNSPRGRAASLRRRDHLALLLALAGSLAAATGCQTFGRPQNTTRQRVMLESQCPPTDPGRMPAKELAKMTLPPYVIEPPDILLVDALRVVPKPPFRIQSFDVLQVIVEGTLLEQPINGLYVVEPGGMLDLGPSYGKVTVGGQSLEEARPQEGCRVAVVELRGIGTRRSQLFEARVTNVDTQVDSLALGAERRRSRLDHPTVAAPTSQRS